MTTVRKRLRGCARPRGLRQIVLGALLVVSLAGCGAEGGGAASHDPSGVPDRPRATSISSPPYKVASQVVTHPSVPDVRVWAPVDGSGWPVVYAVPGSSGSKADFDLLGPALARQGVVVLATDYRPDSTDDQLTREIECGYRHARSIAAEHGGDLHRPVTLLGYSRGARAVFGVLDERRFGPGGSFDGCFAGTPRPDVVAAVDGCYYAFAGWSHPFPVRRLGVGDAKVVLVSGQADDVCPTWESVKAARALEAAGHDVTLVTIPGANHRAPVFHDVVGGRHVAVPDDRAGKRTAQAIMDAIHDLDPDHRS